ncbi:ATP synthase subunit delta [Tamlana sedimentorum]|uniref:ATP synthase subunit delta n=1 Tax=Neotamlana sedimentorum TaxID=1435349 RepID=A0A0D7WGD6_9FLAO|nr:ATP synthase F1 subunit delta [Tamlana sedimentorum]KJD36787.1 ATP synthase subunit delta [Tamlana sedimentorum]
MSGSRAAIRYAKAVFSLATDQNTTEVVNNDMKLIANTIAESKDLSDMLESPVITSAVKKSVLNEVFKGTDKSTLSLINTLISNKRINILNQVAEKYNALFDASKGVELATVTTVVPITPAIEEKVLAKAKELTGKTVVIKNVIDETILGGFILRIGDIQYNASVANQLNKLKQEFTLN